MATWISIQEIFFFSFDEEMLLVVLLLLTVMRIKFNAVQIICLGRSNTYSFISSKLAKLCSFRVEHVNFVCGTSLIELV